MSIFKQEFQKTGPDSYNNDDWVSHILNLRERSFTPSIVTDRKLSSTF